MELVQILEGFNDCNCRGPVNGFGALPPLSDRAKTVLKVAAGVGVLYFAATQLGRKVRRRRAMAFARVPTRR